MAAAGDSSKYDFSLVLVGDEKVGKSCLIQRFIEDTFHVCNAVDITLPIKVKHHTISLDNKKILLSIWDMSGAEMLQIIFQRYYESAQAIIIVYDITNGNSFDSVQKWLQRIVLSGNRTANKILIGNKSDLIAQRVVSFNTAQQFANDLGVRFLETSAKLSTNVPQAFLTAVEEILNRTEPEIAPACRNEISKFDAAQAEIQERADNVHRMSNSLAQMFDDQLFTDVLFETDEGSIGAHKAILVSQSPVFEAMFRNQLKEAQTSKVPVKDIEIDVLKEMLRFLYSCEHPKNLSEIADKLFMAAHKYELNDLKTICENALSRNLNAENVNNIYALAKLYNSDRVLQSATDFMKNN